MNKKQQQELKSLEHYKQEYGYLALRDYSKFNYLTSLGKIIRLKNINRTLCDKRKSLQVEIFVKSQSNGWFVAITSMSLEVAKLSEQIGKNGHKIQRLRTKYKQFGDKWVENRCKPKNQQEFCY